MMLTVVSLPQISSLPSGGQKQEWTWRRGTEESLCHKDDSAPPSRTAPESTDQGRSPWLDVCASGAAREKI